MSTPPILIDSHCHQPAETGDESKVDQWLENSATAGVMEWIAIGTDSSDWNRHAELARTHIGKIHWTAGLHPCHVGADSESEIAKLEALLEDPPEGPPPCALGEIGLDYTRIPKDERDQAVDRQQSAFLAQLRLAGERNLPVVIHSRGTVDDCLTLLTHSGFPPEKAIFHCFAEGPDALRKISATGARCSFTGIPTFRSAASVREALREHGLDSLILETDSPYLSPEPLRGKPNEPARVRIIAEFCADLFNASLEEVSEVTTRNTRDFFRLNSSNFG